MTSPRLIFESTAHLLQSEIQSVFRSFRKSAVDPNLYAIISSRGEKCGLVALAEIIKDYCDEVEENVRSSKPEIEDATDELPGYGM
jgi:hypothetical protein